MSRIVALIALVFSVEAQSKFIIILVLWAVLSFFIHLIGLIFLLAFIRQHNGVLE